MKKRILIADDDPGILDALEIMLQDQGYHVTTSTKGKEILKMQNIDLILLDILMSGIDGRDICKSLKKQKSKKHIPIIIVSANKHTEKIAKEAGADDFITKPFEMNDLLNKIQKYAPNS